MNKVTRTMNNYDEKTSSAECMWFSSRPPTTHHLKNKTTTWSNIPRNISTINMQSYRNSKVPVSVESTCCVYFDMHFRPMPWFVMTSWSCEQRWPQTKRTYALHIRNTKISFERRMINMSNVRTSFWVCGYHYVPTQLSNHCRSSFYTISTEY
jgi:hypothetical protein